MNPMIRLAQFASLEAVMAAMAMGSPRVSAGAGMCPSPLERQWPGRGLDTAIAECAPANQCRDCMTSGRFVAVGGGATVVAAAIPVGASQRVDRIVVVTSTAAGFELSNFSINNQPQWTQGHIFHSALFAPGGDSNTSFKGDQIAPGSQVVITYTNLDAVAQTLWIALIGPGR